MIIAVALTVGVGMTTTGSPLASIPTAFAPISATRVGDAGAPGDSAPAVLEPVADTVRLSLDPVVAIDGGTADQHRRLGEAIDRFRGAGFALPDLSVTFADPTSCEGHYGLYRHSDSAPEITICTELDFVYEHELAHAWVEFWTTEERRARFMGVRGLGEWNDPADAWGDRGVEQAAVVIQQALGLPLPTVLGREFENRSRAFEVLTGLRDPRLADRPGTASAVAASLEAS